MWSYLECFTQSPFLKNNSQSLNFWRPLGTQSLTFSYSLQRYFAKTDDGYFLTFHRLAKNNIELKSGKPVILIHGLLVSLTKLFRVPQMTGSWIEIHLCRIISTNKATMCGCLTSEATNTPSSILHISIIKITSSGSSPSTKSPDLIFKPLSISQFKSDNSRPIL